MCAVTKTSRQSLLCQGVRVLLDGYAGATALWLALWLGWGDQNGWLAALNAWAFWGLATGLPIGAVRLSRRSQGFLVLWAGFLSALLTYRYAHILPKRSRPKGAGSKPNLRVLSFNLLKIDRNLAAVAALLDREQPDIALFQEATPELCARLESRLATRYPYRVWLPHAPTQMGLALVSRHPFAVTGIWDAPALEPYTLRVQVVIHGESLDIYNVQFISPTNEVRRLGPTRLLQMRTAQVRQVLDAVKAEKRPALIVGDWNTTEGTAIYQEAARQLKDGWLGGGRGPGWTWPVSALPFFPLATPPMLRLDYCFLTPGLQATAMHVVRHPLGSDHAPIVVNVTW